MASAVTDTASRQGDRRLDSVGLSLETHPCQGFSGLGRGRGSLEKVCWARAPLFPGMAEPGLAAALGGPSQRLRLW